MNHQEAKAILAIKLPEDSLSLIKVEVFRLSWEGKGYNVIAEETGYDHDYVRKAGSQLWNELSKALEQTVNKRNFLVPNQFLGIFLRYEVRHGHDFPASG